MAEAREVRQITDSKVLAALSHPVRRRLMDVLDVYGAATVGGMAERTGQAVGNISHHVKVLAAAGLIAEAPELAKDRRERWWRLVSASLHWTARDFDDDPADQAVAMAAASLNLERHLGLVRAWHAVREERPRWNGAAFSPQQWVRLTPEELGEVEREMLDVLRRWAHRRPADDGRNGEPVFLFVHGVPAEP